MCLNGKAVAIKRSFDINISKKGGITVTREETIGVLTILKSAYPRFYQGMTKGDAETVINLWSAMFSDVEVEAVKLALYKIISTSQYPPTVAEVRQAIMDTQVGMVKDVGEVWNEITRAIRNFGYMREKEALETLSPMAVKSIHHMGGWKTLCMSETVMADRAHFIKIFTQLEKRENEERLIPLAVREKIQLNIEMNKSSEEKLQSIDYTEPLAIEVNEPVSVEDSLRNVRSMISAISGGAS